MDRQLEILGSPRQTVADKGLGRAFSSAMVRRQRTGTRWLLTAAAALALSACGQKGPLYLPAPATAAPQATPGQTTPPQAATPAAAAR